MGLHGLDHLPGPRIYTADGFEPCCLNNLENQVPLVGSKNWRARKKTSVYLYAYLGIYMASIIVVS